MNLKTKQEEVNAIETEQRNKQREMKTKQKTINEFENVTNKTKTQMICKTRTEERNTLKHLSEFASYARLLQASVHRN